MQYCQSVIVAWTLDSFIRNVYDILELQEMKLIIFFSLYILLFEEHDCSGKLFGKNCLFIHKYQ